MANKTDHVLVFSTNKSMHERFSAPKQQRSVYVLNDDGTVQGEKDDDDGTLLDKEMETNEMHSSFNKGNIGKKKQITKNQRPPLTRRRRKPPMAYTLENGTECADDKMLPVNFQSRRSSLQKPGLRYGKYNYIGKRFTGRSRGRKQTNTFSSNNLSFPRRWRPKLVSKDQLDDEIDKYMAEVNQEPSSFPKEENKVAFNEQFLEETEQFLKEYEQVK